MIILVVLISCMSSSYVDQPMKDGEQALLLLSSLLKSFKYCKQTLLVGRTSLAFDDVLKALRDNERMTMDVVSQSGETVLAVQIAEKEGVARAMTARKE